MRQHIVILGAGEIGSAINNILDEQSHLIHLWDKDPDRVRNQQPLKEILPTANILFLCIPSFAIRSAVTNLSDLLRPNTVVISLAKSIETDTMLTMDEVLIEILPDGQPIAILAGPLIAEELASGAGGIAVAASHNPDVLKTIVNLFDETSIVTETTDDIHGAAICGVIKNIYAMGVGAAHGLGWGDNKKGWLAGKALCEMLIIVEQLGGLHETVCGASGFSDFIATGFSDFSGHRTFGVQLAQGVNPQRNKEGCLALPSIMEMLGSKAKELPLLSALNRAISHGESISDALESVLYK